MTEKKRLNKKATIFFTFERCDFKKQEHLSFVSIMQRIIRKCCNCLADMKIMRCLYVSFYIFVCLFGNIVTIIFLYKQYHKSQISENKESNTETTTENSRARKISGFCIKSHKKETDSDG